VAATGSLWRLGLRADFTAFEATSLENHNVRKPRAALIGAFAFASLGFCAAPFMPLPVIFAQSAPADAVAYVRFDDPFEHAFSLDIPQGWTARGGLFRLGFSDQRPMVDLVSPDGRIDIRLGDVAVPSYSIPNQFHPREGEPYDLGAQAQMTVARYRSGEEFAKLYAVQRFLRQCTSLDPQPSEGDPPVRNYIQPEAGSSSRGQATYACDSGAGRRIGYVYAQTTALPTLWQVTSLASFIAPPDRFGNTLTGIQPVTDPLGNEHNVWMGPKANYWMDGQGRYLNATTSPGPGWQQLKPHD